MVHRLTNITFIHSRYMGDFMVGVRNLHISFEVDTILKFCALINMELFSFIFRT